MKLALRAIHRGSGAGRTVTSCRHPDEVISAELSQNARTCAALRRLGVPPETALPLVFHFETAGPEADRELAEFLRHDAGYRVEHDQDGLIGWTPPLALDRQVLDDWVRMMLYASYAHGGCVFAGWAVIVDAPLPQPARSAATESLEPPDRIVSRGG